jgi:hypothetical protein
MHRSEQPEHELCVSCGNDIVAAIDRAYVVSDEEAICFECALRLGGTWDEVTGTWIRPPDVRGLPIHPSHAHR